MMLKKFIFSEQTNHRLIRHLSFWLFYSFYFYLQSIPPKTFEELYTARPYFIALVNTGCFAFFYVAVTYIFIYYIYPQTIKKEKYLHFVLAFLLMYGCGIFCNYFMTGLFLRTSGYQPDNFDNRLSLSYCNTRWGMIIAIVATGIKLSKDWYLQQMENTIILRKKNRAEIQLRKSRLHPDLLLRTLSNIQTSVSDNFSNSGPMILKLSDILSYSLYESDEDFVPAEKEIEEIKNLVSLEQIALTHNKHIRLDLHGDFGNKYVAPMLLFKLFEECIALLQQHEKPGSAINLTITAKADKIFIRISLHADEVQTYKTKWDQLVESLQANLAGHYKTGDYMLQTGTGVSETNLMLEINPVCKKDMLQKITEPVYEHA